MIYFDNAATGGFKPNAVIDTATTVIKYLCANPTRSAHRLSLTGAKTVNDCRQVLAELFGASADRVIFTKNCTEALNLAIFGSLKKGGHIITTVYEHNSVLRPLFFLKEKGLIELDIVSPTLDKPFIDNIADKIKPNTYLIITTSASNVTGEVLPTKKISALAKKHNILHLVDGAQGGGHIPLSIKDDGFNMIALAAHKGLYGIMGSGALILDNSVSISPLLYGGTGTETFNTSQPDCYPEKLEAGTLNLPAIAALYEGASYVKNNLKNFNAHLYNRTSGLISELKNIDGVECFSAPNSVGICAFRLVNMPSVTVADILNNEYDIAVRSGFHCAPLMHKFLKTDDEGLVRVSLAVQNSAHEINFFLSAIEKIVKTKSF